MAFPLEYQLAFYILCAIYFIALLLILGRKSLSNLSKLGLFLLATAIAAPPGYFILLAAAFSGG